MKHNNAEFELKRKLEQQDKTIAGGNKSLIEEIKRTNYTLDKVLDAIVNLQRAVENITIVNADLSGQITDKQQTGKSSSSRDFIPEIDTDNMRVSGSGKQSKSVKIDMSDAPDNL